MPEEQTREPIRGVNLARAGGMIGLLSTLSNEVVEMMALPPNLKTPLAGIASIMVGALMLSFGSWGRDSIAKGNRSVLARFAAMVGCVLIALQLSGCAWTQSKQMGVELSPVEAVELDLIAAEQTYDDWRIAGGDLNATQARRLQLAFQKAHAGVVTARSLEIEGAQGDTVLLALQSAQAALATAAAIMREEGVQ